MTAGALMALGTLSCVRNYTRYLFFEQIKINLHLHKDHTSRNTKGDRPRILNYTSTCAIQDVLFNPERSLSVYRRQYSPQLLRP